MKAWISSLTLHPFHLLQRFFYTHLDPFPLRQLARRPSEARGNLSLPFPSLKRIPCFSLPRQMVSPYPIVLERTLIEKNKDKQPVLRR